MVQRKLSAVALALTCAMAIAACSDDPSPSPSPSVSASPSPTVTEPAPSPSESPAPTPAQPTPDPTAVPSTWNPTSASDAGIVEDDVEEVVGAWRLPRGTVAAVYSYKNDSGVDPEDVFVSYFGTVGEDDGVDVDHETRTTDAGTPVLVVRMTPSDAATSHEGQLYFYALTPALVTAAFASGPADEAMSADHALWQIINATQ